MILQIVRFKSHLTDEDVEKMYRERAPKYRALAALKQKYYLKYPGTGEHGAVYVWDSEEAAKEFRESELGRSIASTYQVDGSPEVVPADVVMTLRNA